MTTAYRFIPWVRRGLAASIDTKDAAGPLPARASFDAGLTVTGAGKAGVKLHLYGPGDVIGLDPRTIIRTDPKPHATDVEPNYLAQVEFDLPELPWAFSPAAPDDAGRLRPWLVLVVLDATGLDAVAPPKVLRERPLPFVRLEGQQLQQLPDLAQSWAWAHGQQMVGWDEADSAPDTLPRALATEPDLSLSRLVCPRRLKPMTGYMACLVPAFDVGVQRGLGGKPPADASAEPAWRVAALPAALELPVFHHWTFATGPDGDFESLARKLKPFKAPPTLGTVPMYVGDAVPELAPAPPGGPGRVLPMDGALRASEGEPAGLVAQVDPVLIDRLTAEVNAPAIIAAGAAPDATRAISAPIYAGFHVKRQQIDAGAPGWLRELNLDPRARAAAGIAAEVLRQNQEEFMQACWEQVGDVQRANMLLNMAALATQALDKLHGRIARLPPSSLLSLASPALVRLPWEGLTIAARVERTSLPDALFTAAYRRLSSPRNVAVRAAAAALKTKAQVGLAERMAPGIASAEPNRFVPDGIVSTRAFDATAAPSDFTTPIDRSPAGFAASVTRDQLVALKGSPGPADTGLAGIALGEGVQRSGMIGEMQLAGLAGLGGLFGNAAAGDPALRAAGVLGTLNLLKRISGASPEAVGYVVELRADGLLDVGAVEVDASGTMMMSGRRGTPGRVIGKAGDQLRRGGAAAIGRALDELPAGMIAAEGTPAGRGEFRIERDARGRIAGNDMDFDAAGRPRVTPRQPKGASKTFGGLSRDAATIDRLGAAFGRLADGFRRLPDGEPKAVRFDLAAAAKAATDRLAPRGNVAARVSSMISIAGAELKTVGDLSIVGLTAAKDRVLCAPQIVEPAYKRLAAHDREAFMPGIGALPRNGIALLETNSRFIEAYMIGLNHEMARELLWRRYPTDQRGTVFRYFWDWFDDQPDIGPIHQFSPAKPLGFHTKGDGSGQLVLLVRGDLLRRYPNSIIYGWPAMKTTDGKRQLMDPIPPDKLALPVFHGAFAPDVTMVGFDLTRPEVIAGEGYYFVIEQQPTEPRFGFDQEKTGAKAGPVDNWLNARWVDTGTAPGANLSLSTDLPIATGTSPDGVRYGKDAAHMAAVSLQRPFRVAVHASYLTSV